LRDDLSERVYWPGSRFDVADEVTRDSARRPLSCPPVLLLACPVSVPGPDTPSPEADDAAERGHGRPGRPAERRHDRPGQAQLRRLGATAFKTEALAAASPPPPSTAPFAGVLPNLDILAKDDVAAGIHQADLAYLDTAASPSMSATRRQVLVERQGGAPQATNPTASPADLVAIWGLESAYGVNTGGYNVIEALTPWPMAAGVRTSSART